MNKVGSFNVVYKLVIAGLSSAISAVLFGYLMAKFKNPTISIFFLLLVVTFVVLIISFIVEKLIDNSLEVRKVISGKDYIEGHWHDISVKNDEVFHSVLLKIQYVNGGYQVSGTTYTPDGQHIATFHSRRAVYHNRVLFCEYESQTQYFELISESGIMKLHFDTPATSYTGIYFDYTGKLNFFIRGVKLTNKTVKEYDGFNDYTSKIEFVLKAIKLEQSKLNKKKA